MGRPKLASRGKRSHRRLVALNLRRVRVGLEPVRTLTQAVDGWAELRTRERTGQFKEAPRDAASA